MGPAGMTSSGTSLRSGSELVDSDMESSTQSLASFTQHTPLSAQVVCLYSKKADNHMLLGRFISRLTVNFLFHFNVIPVFKKSISEGKCDVVICVSRFH